MMSFKKSNLFHCISVDTVCLVLAIINVIVNLLNLMWYTLLWGVILVMYINSDSDSEMDYFEGEVGDLNMDIRTWKFNMGHVVFYFCLVPLASLLTIIFSFLLCIGISNGHPRQVKAYLVYGVGVTVLGLVASIVLLSVDVEPDAGLWVLFVCVLHTLFLLLVFRTLRKMLEGSKFSDNIRLVVEDNRHFKSGATVY